MQKVNVTKSKLGQSENEDLVQITMDNGNYWEVQRLDGEFNQQMGCELNKNGMQNPDYDDEAERAVEIANQA